MKDIKEIIMHIVFLIAACVSILAVALICIFLFANGLPAIAKNRANRISDRNEMETHE